MIVVSLFLTVFVYLAFPVIYITTVGKVPEKTAKKFALINCIIGVIIFAFIRLATGSDAIGSTGFAPAVLYYFIAKAILKENKVETNPDQQQNNTPTPTNQNNKEDK